MLDVEDAIVRRFLPLAQAVTRYHCRRYPWNYDEVYSDALLALVKAIRSYSARHGATLQTWVRNKAQWEVQHGIRTRSGFRCAAKRRQRTYCKDHGRLSQLPSREQEPWEPLQRCEALTRFLRGLLPQEREAVERCYVRGERKKDVARSMGFSAAYLSKMLQRALAFLRDRSETIG